MCVCVHQEETTGMMPGQQQSDFLKILLSIGLIYLPQGLLGSILVALTHACCWASKDL